MALKIRPEHIQALREGMAPFLSQDIMDRYTDAGLSEACYLWDAFWTARRRATELREVLDTIYTYANDDHLYSVFKLLWKEKQGENKRA